jgi:hypothetical protein
MTPNQTTRISTDAFGTRPKEYINWLYAKADPTDGHWNDDNHNALIGFALRTFGDTFNESWNVFIADTAAEDAAFHAEYLIREVNREHSIPGNDAAHLMLTPEEEDLACQAAQAGGFDSLQAYLDARNESELNGFESQTPE